jgi:hypothetical protein
VEHIGIALERIVNRSLHVRGLSKADLAPGDRVFVKTRNSLYDIRVLGNGMYSVSGGWFDRKGLSPMTTRIAGCTWGGSAIKVDIVAACGLSLEFGNRLITSTIRKVIHLPFVWQN